MSLLIRKAEINDAPTMANIHARSWEAAYSQIVPIDAIKEVNLKRPGFWNRILSEPEGNHKFSICENENIIGLMVLGDSRDNDIKEKTLEVISLYLLPEYFGKGYGKPSLDFAIDIAKQKGYQKMSLWVLEENHRARNFYKKCGFEFDGTQKEILIGKPLIEMRYTLLLT